MNQDVARRIVLLLAGLCALIALAGACSSSSPAPAATATPTKTPVTIATLVPTATSVPTAMQAPTDTPIPAPSPTATLDPSLIVPGRDPGISPFTGLRPADPAVLARRPLAVKVANLKSVRPQAGLNKADIVVESQIEFSATRFTAIYQSQDAQRIGSIRSARLIDIELPAIFDAILCFSGGVEPVRQKLYQSDLGDHIAEALRYFDPYYRDPSIKAPDNLFASTAGFWKLADKKGWNRAPAPAAGWVFAQAVPSGGSPATRIDIPYAEAGVRWTYDAASGLWLRSVGGQPHVDAVDGKQLSAADVVLLTANHVKTLILEYGTQEMAGGVNRSVEVQLWGEGPLKILRDGRVYEGKWLRPERHAPVRFVDAQGKDIPLKPGNSWWQVVPPTMKVTVGG